MIRIAPLVLVWALLTGGSAILAQAQAPAAAFEVASVRLGNPSAAAASPFGAMPMAMPQSGGRFTGQNLTLRWLIVTAYNLQDFQVTGGPAWQTADKFDITAKAENPNTTWAQMRPMLQALLADRFKLKAHLETREMPIYALVLARSDGKLGANITPSTADCGDLETQQQKLLDEVSKGNIDIQKLMNAPCGTAPWMDAPGGFGMKFNGQPMSSLTTLLTQATGKIVKDETGLKGNYDYKLAMDPQFLMSMMSQLGVSMPANVTLPGSDNPALLTAIQEQLGVKVDSRRGPVEILVIDSAEKPTPD